MHACCCNGQSQTCVSGYMFLNIETAQSTDFMLGERNQKVHVQAELHRAGVQDVPLRKNKAEEVWVETATQNARHFHSDSLPSGSYPGKYGGPNDV